MINDYTEKVKENLKVMYQELKKPSECTRRVIYEASSNMYYILWFKSENDVVEYKIQGIHEIFTMPPGAYFLAYSDMCEQIAKKTPKKVSI